MYRRNFTNYFSGNRKVLYIILCIVLVSVFSLTIVYAALNTVLKITGNADVLSASWDVHLDNVRVTSGSVSGNSPTIVNPTTASFSIKLINPGDYYEFTIDAVNDGSIDAMIDSVVKTPTLTTEQSKYLNYIVEYQNGESINTKQLVESNSFVRLKVRVEYRKDIVANDLPRDSVILDLSFKVNYVQADEVGTTIVPNKGNIVKVVSGDYDTVGSEICIEKECFYVMSSDTDSLTMLAKYNLLIGNKYDKTNGTLPLKNPTGKQDEIAKGFFPGYNEENPIVGTKPFSFTNYWSSTVSVYPSYVYNENSYLYEYVGEYKKYLESFGPIIRDARLITLEELEIFGCNLSNLSCNNAPSWLYATTYWTGTASSTNNIWHVYITGVIKENDYEYTNSGFGIRPVIVISKDIF